MSDTTTDDGPGTGTHTWLHAGVVAVLVTAACLAFALSLAAVAELVNGI